MQTALAFGGDVVAEVRKREGRGRWPGEGHHRMVDESSPQDTRLVQGISSVAAAPASEQEGFDAALNH
jgi:hypothetical protein